MFLMDSVEFLILRNLLHNEEYIRKVIPFIKADYFEDITQKIVFEEISSFVEQYNKPATKEILCICLLYTSPSPRDAHESRMPSSA